MYNGEKRDFGAERIGEFEGFLFGSETESERLVFSDKKINKGRKIVWVGNL